MRCAISYHLYNLKMVKNIHGVVLLLVKLQTCNFTKSKNPPWVFYTFLKLYKWYQMAQSVLYIYWFLYECSNDLLQTKVKVSKMLIMYLRLFLNSFYFFMKRPPTQSRQRSYKKRTSENARGVKEWGKTKSLLVELHEQIQTLHNMFVLILRNFVM